MSEPENFTQLDDGHLWAAYVGGADEAFAELRRRHEGPLYWYLLLSLRDVQRAAAGLVRVMELVAACRRNHEGFETFRGWLYAVATQSAVPRREGDDFGLAELLEEMRHPEAESAQEVVLQSVADLRRPFRQPLLLVAVAGLSLQEAAAACNSTPERTAECIHKACRALLRSVESLQREGADGL